MPSLLIKKNTLFLLLLLIFSDKLFAQEFKNLINEKGFTLEVKGEVQTFHLLDKEKVIVIAVDGIDAKIENLSITAKKAAWLPYTQTLYLEEDIEVKGQNFVFRAKQMQYHVKERRGLIKDVNAVIKAPQDLQTDKTSDFVHLENERFLFIKAEEIETIKNRFRLEKIKISTNGYKDPYYHIKSSSAEFQENSSFESWNNVICLGKLPVFYFPYLAKDLKNDWPWVQIKISQNSRYGFHGEVNLKAKIDNQNIYFGLQPMELRGIKGNLWYERETATALTGLKMEGIKENWRGESKLDLGSFDDHFQAEDPQGQLDSESRYRVHAFHRQKLFWNFSFDAEIDRIDSVDHFIWKSGDEYEKSQNGSTSPFGNEGELKKGSFRRDYHRNEFYEDKSPESIGQLKWSYGPFFGRIIYKDNINHFKYDEERNDNKELLIKPGLHFNIHGLEIENSFIPLILDSQLRLEDLEMQTTNLDNTVSSYESERLHLRTTLSTPFLIGKRFHLEPFLGFDETGYGDTHFDLNISNGSGLIEDFSFNLNADPDISIDHTLNRFTFLYGASLHFILSNEYQWDSSLFHFSGLTHRIIPKIQFYGSSEPNKKPSDLPQFDIIDQLQKDDYLIFRIDQYFDVNRDASIKNFISWYTWAQYFVEREKSERLDHWGTEIQIVPFEWLEIRSLAIFEPGEGLQKSITSVQMNWQNRWKLKAIERWEENYPWQTEFFSDVKIGDRYSLYGGFTFTNKKLPDGFQDRDQFIEYYFGIRRRYHELTIQFEYRRDRLFNENHFSLHLRLF